MVSWAEASRNPLQCAGNLLAGISEESLLMFERLPPSHTAQKGATVAMALVSVWRHGELRFYPFPKPPADLLNTHSHGRRPSFLSTFLGTFLSTLTEL